MAFTGVLGTIDSYLGNLVLGYYNPTPAGPTTPAGNVLSITQTASANVVYERSVTNTLALAGSAVRVIEGIADNTLAITQTAAVLKYKIRDVSQTFVPTQSVTVQKIYNINVVSTFVVTEAVARNIVKSIDVSNTLAITQTDVGQATKVAKNILTFAGTADAFVSKVAKNDISFGQTLDRIITAHRSTFSNFIPFQIVLLGPNTYRRDVLSTLGLSQTITVAKVKDVRQLVNFSQTLVGNVSKLTQNTLALTQTVNVNVVYSRAVNDALTLIDSPSKVVAKAVAATSILAFEQFARGKFVFNQTITQTIVFTQDLVRTRILKSVLSTLNLTSSSTAFKIAPRSITQTVTFTQSVNVNVNYVRTASNNLTFLHGHYRYIGLGDLSEIFVPEAIGVKVRSLIVLRGPDRAITLPSPEFGDGDEFQGKINIIRFEGGSKRIYRKNSDKYKLTYEFQLDYHKIRELKLFIQAYNSKTFVLENHKGEIWQVIFASNPFEITEASYWAEACGNKFIIPLEFEGVRVN